MPGSPTRCTTRAVPRRAVVIAVAIASSSRARPTSTPGDPCGAIARSLPDAPATIWSSVWTIGCRPDGMSASPGGATEQRGDPGKRLRTRLDVAYHRCGFGALGRGHEQPKPEEVSAVDGREALLLASRRYVLSDRCTAKPTKAEKATETRTRLVRAVGTDRRESRSSDPSLSGMWSAPTMPKRSLINICAGQGLCGAPRRTRTDDPILTMDVLCRLS